MNNTEHPLEPRTPSDRDASNQLLHNIADLFSEPIFLLDRSRRVLFTNDGARRITGLTESELLDKQIESVITLLAPPLNSHVTRLHLQKTSPLTLTAKLDDGNHPITFLRVDAIPYLVHINPDIFGIAVISTETPSSETPITSNTIYMQILGSLTMRIAHDFNNALTSIIGNIELVEELFTKATASDSSPEHLERARPMLQDARRKSLEMGELVGLLQKYARQQPPTRETIDINQALQDSLNMAQKLLGQRIDIDFLPAHELPELYVDRAQLDQLLFSLLGNSKEAMPQGGRVTIETAVALLDQEFTFTHPGSRSGSYVRISVTDTGVGMDAQAVQDIFNLFSSTKRGELLGGLGLPSVYATVKHNNGYIDVESWLGKGTRFDIYLPITGQQASAAEANHKIVQPKPGSTFIPNKIKKIGTRQQTTPVILVVEDEIDIQRFLDRSITNAGYKPIILGRGDRALDVYKQLATQGQPPSLVIADLGLPGLDGRSLFKRIRQFDPHAALLLTSGYQIALQENGRETEEGFEFIQKPFEQSTLLARIEVILRNR